VGQASWNATPSLFWPICKEPDLGEVAQVHHLLRLRQQSTRISVHLRHRLAAFSTAPECMPLPGSSVLTCYGFMEFFEACNGQPVLILWA
jgi:hypothetical protein